jgi:Flp pilus assembly protein TadG
MDLLIGAKMRISTSHRLKTSAARGLLRRLRDDKRGNVIALTAASVMPIMGIVGSSIDISRGYMAKTRLQAACDAGTLAGRRAMTTLTLTTDARNKASKLFTFNFPASEYDATAITFSTSATSEGRVDGTAGASVPTTVMGLFGKTKFDLTVTCSADLQVPNIDTMMVLDVTGSMADCPDNSSCGGGTGSKIEGLRGAVRSFYTTLAAAAASSPRTQLRYGFVPYSHTVNARNLFVASPDASQLPLTQLVDTWGYQSRVANFTTPVTSGTPTQTGTPVTTSETYRKGGASADTKMSYNDCTGYEANTWFSIDDGADAGTVSDPNPAGSPIYKVGNTFTSARPTSGAYQKIDFVAATSRSGWNTTNSATYYRACTRSRTVTDFTSTPAFGFTNWTYKRVNYNVAQYKALNAVNYVSSINTSTATVPVSGSYDPVALRALANQTGMTSSSTTWSGCIEERDTTAVTNFRPIPNAALDLDFIAPGTTDASRWRPMLADLKWSRAGPAEETKTGDNSRPYANCPGAPIRNLNTMTLTQLDAYLPLLQPEGATYHDIGMVWGLRLISPNGMFASRNIVGTNGGQISRHVIFMTDGLLAPNYDIYSSYGIETVDRRVAAGNSDLSDRHAARFQALCDAARSQQLSVWVIAFGTALTSNLTSCADPGRAFQANNTADLNTQFRRIATEIADLRLTK